MMRFDDKYEVSVKFESEKGDNFSNRQLAGAGTATVDRVLNNRAHVSESARQRVIQAKRAIEAGTSLRSRPRPWRLRCPARRGRSIDRFSGRMPSGLWRTR